MPSSLAPRPAFALALALAILPSAARAQWRARVLARAPAAPAFDTAPVQARVGDDVELTVALFGPRGLVLSDAPSLRVAGRARAADGPLPRGATVRWLRVEPLLEHTRTPSPNPGLRSFSNSVLYGPRHGRWLGYDHLEYDTLPLEPSVAVSVSGATVHARAAHPSLATNDAHGGAGSLWLAAEVALPDGTVVRTPAGSAVDLQGLSREVQRVSFRSGDDYLGWLGTYFNVPDVFGSNGGTDATHQSDRYTGADCADVLVGALRASGRREVHYTSVAGIGSYAEARTPVLTLGADGVVRDASGAPRVLRWGADVAPGDLVTIDYSNDPTHSLPRAWDHIGALVEDRGAAGAADGVLDGADVLRHMAERGLSDMPLSTQAPIRMVLWRWKRNVWR